jgi:type II secretory pathway component PulC
MKGPILTCVALCTALAAVGVHAAAQQTPAGQQAQAQPQRPAAAEVTLVYEREVYAYRQAGRRDPFRPLTDDEEFGPRFEQVSLQGIIYSPEQRTSVALLGDGNRVYRVRQGDVLGNIRVLEIGPSRVVVAVDVFGMIRRETLEMQRRGGDQS